MLDVTLAFSSRPKVFAFLSVEIAWTWKKQEQRWKYIPKRSSADGGMMTEKMKQKKTDNEHITTLLALQNAEKTWWYLCHHSPIGAVSQNGVIC